LYNVKVFVKCDAAMLNCKNAKSIKCI